MLNHSVSDSNIGDDSTSLASSSKGGGGSSLLERIRAQQQQAQQQRQYAVLPNQFEVPHYNPNEPSSDFGDATLGDSSYRLGGSTFFSNAWRSFSHTLESGVHSTTNDFEQDAEVRTSLLPPTGEDYTMRGYAQMFVNDVNSAFTSLPIPARVTVVILLLYILFRLL